MKRLIRVVGIFMLLNLAIPCLAEVGNEPTFSSEKPLYAFVVLDEEANKVLKIVFDESGGTGKGYDTIYADLNLNDDMTDEEPIKGTLQRRRDRLSCALPPLDAHVPYNENGEGVEKPWQLNIRYNKYKRGERIDQRFSLEAKIRLRDKAGEWEYSFRAELNPAEDPEGVMATTFGGKTSLQIQTRPDKKKKGNIGIAAYMKTGERFVRCSKDGQPIKARVEIRNEQGKVIHSEDVSSDKLVSGRGGRCRYSVRIPSGRHDVEVKVDTGPLGGVLKGTKIIVISGYRGIMPEKCEVRVEVADVLRMLRMKLSKEAEMQINGLIEAMYKKADELEKTGS